MSEEETLIYLPVHNEAEYDGNPLEKWDDTELIKSYDKAVSKAKRQICMKLQSELGLTDAAVQEVLSDAGTESSKKKKKKKNKKKGGPAGKDKWEVGSACRAMFSEDGEDYEAKIISIIDSIWCKVKFIGYDNEEEVLLKELSPSLGKNVIKLQIEMAEQDAALKQLQVDSEEQDDTESQHSQPPQGATADPKLIPPLRRPPMFLPSSPPPAPPPFPPFNMGSFSRFSKPMNGVPIPHYPTGNEAHNAMMMSWFMCGYYTGYYQREVDLRLCDEQP